MVTTVLLTLVCLICLFGGAHLWWWPRREHESRGSREHLRND